MVEISIGLGIILSLVLSEALGVTAGGIIVPGYIALFLHQPIQVVSTFVVAVIVLIIIKLLSYVPLRKKKNCFSFDFRVFLWVLIKNNLYRHREHK